jgi:hypothetical protein
VLAFTDSALARLVIAAARVPAEKRGALLKRVAAIADPSPQCAYARRKCAVEVRVSDRGRSAAWTVGFIREFLQRA